MFSEQSDKTYLFQNLSTKNFQAFLFLKMSSAIPLQVNRKRNRNDQLSEANVKKQSRNSGQEYLSESGKVVPSKMFTEVNSCCSKKCYSSIDQMSQKELHSKFWNFGDYHGQNMMLDALMKRRCLANISENSSKKKTVSWTYLFPRHNEDFVVCKNLILNVLCIGKKRIEWVQKKISSNSDLRDNRGKHENHLVKLTDAVKDLILAHCENIPHKESHYYRENTKLKYFENPELHLQTIYDLFLDYYASITNDRDAPIDFSTYSKYFNHYMNFGFGIPRTDVCNFCSELETSNETNAELDIHKMKVEAYKELKQQILSMQNILCCEFEFGQDLPLPKIPGNDQFYKRLLWLHIFNVHVFNTDRSYMFPFVEGQVKKGANTVCNLLLHVIFEELKLNYFNKIFLFSYACGGQNRNYHVLAFLSLLASKLEIEINHIYLIQGHSYSQCDRNFRTYGQAKKRMESIETDEEYIKLIKKAKNPPFIVVREKDYSLKDFEVTIEAETKVPKDFMISKAVKIVYAPNGQIQAYNEYNGQPMNFTIDSKITFDDLENSRKPAAVGISQEKIRDLNSRTRFLHPKGKLFIDAVLKKHGS